VVRIELRDAAPKGAFILKLSAHLNSLQTNSGSYQDIAFAVPQLLRMNDPLGAGIRAFDLFRKREGVPRYKFEPMPRTVYRGERILTNWDCLRGRKGAAVI